MSRGRVAFAIVVGAAVNAALFFGVPGTTVGSGSQPCQQLCKQLNSLCFTSGGGNWYGPIYASGKTWAVTPNGITPANPQWTIVDNCTSCDSECPGYLGRAQQ